LIFVDTSFWVALRNRRDAHHDEAIALLKRHTALGLITSDHVRGETWTFLRRRAGHAAAVGFLDALERSSYVDVQRIDAVSRRKHSTGFGFGVVMSVSTRSSMPRALP
jgi:predicted nucleic acid-binding protein